MCWSSSVPMRKIQYSYSEWEVPGIKWPIEQHLHRAWRRLLVKYAIGPAAMDLYYAPSSDQESTKQGSLCPSPGQITHRQETVRRPLRHGGSACRMSETPWEPYLSRAGTDHGALLLVVRCSLCSWVTPPTNPGGQLVNRRCGSIISKLSGHEEHAGVLAWAWF